MDDLHHAVLHFTRRHRLVEGTDAVLAALSGGPDSVALAVVLADLVSASELPVRLSLAHLNHGLRGDESDAEEQFCRDLARRLGLKIVVERADGLSAARGSIEAAARRVRYDFLARAAAAERAGAVATGHQADDVAETVLMRVIRGAGIVGLGVMAPSRPLGRRAGRVRLIRPMLAVSRSAVLAFLEARGQPFCTDSSNAHANLTRNRIRRRLIPLLEREFPQFSAASLAALSRSAVEIRELLDGLVEAAWNGLLASTGPGEVCLDARACARLSPAVLKMAARRALERVCGREPAPALRAEHLNELAALPGREPGVTVALPGGLLARREHCVIYFGRQDEPEGLPERELPLGGAVDVPEAAVRIECRVLPEGAIGAADAARRATDMEVFLNPDALRLPLCVRSRRPGDRFHPLGAPGARRLKKFLIDRRVPRHERDRLPLVVTAAGRIAWVVGYRIGEAFRLPDRPVGALHLRAVTMAGAPGQN